MSIAPNATEERPQALGRVFRHEFARALAYLRLGAIPAYIVAYFGIRRVFRVTATNRRISYPLPECVTTGVLSDGRRLAFIGLERTGGIMVYDVSKPVRPVLSDYLNVDDDSNE